MCAAVGQGIRTPYIVVVYLKLHKEVLRRMVFPIANQNNPKNFLPPQESREKSTIATNRLLNISWL